MVTLGQRRGIGLPGGGPKRYVVDIDHATATVTVGDESMLSVRVHARRCTMAWAHEPVSGEVLVQSSAHGDATAGDASRCHRRRRRWCSGTQPQRRWRPGQSVVFYDATDTYVLGGGIAR